MNWYLIQVKPSRHKLAEDHLRRQGFEVFLPLMKKTSKNRVKFVNNLKPLFPNYLFMGTERDNIPWKSINATKGVLKAVTLDGHYRAIASDIVEDIKCRCDHNGILLKLVNITAGDRVKIENGPLTDFVSKVEKIKDTERVWVLIEILQQQIRAAVSVNDISKIS